MHACMYAYNIIHYTEIHKIPGPLLLGAFENVIDSVFKSFIDTALFNFKIGKEGWIKTFY